MRQISTTLGFGAFVCGFAIAANGVFAQRQLEPLGRGLVAVRYSTSSVYVGWRLLATDPDDIAFNLYRVTGTTTNKLNALPLTNTTDYVDTTATLSLTNIYFVRPVIGGIEQMPCTAFVLPANAPTRQYIPVPLQKPPGGTTPDGTNYTYSAGDCSAGDLDGDGEYELVLKWDPSNAKDNSQSGYTGNVFLDAYKLDGTFMWRIDLGINIRAGAHYTQFMVYDLNGDGRAEVACKTAPGTIDGQGNFVIMPGDNPYADYRNSSGYILSGPEYLTIFDGLTGAALWTTNYIPPRGNVSSWGDSYGNRVDRFLACVAYLDGVRPSLVMCRGYYTRAVLAAWDWRGARLTQRWVFDTWNGYSSYEGQGNHNLSVGDVDGDGRDEIVYGACAIDHDGRGLYTTRLGHGDAMHLSDLDPGRPGLEVWQCHEDPSSYGPYGLEFRDAGLGQPLWGISATDDVGRAVAIDIDPRYPGYECWGPRGGLMNATGIEISSTRPSQINFAIWWDADLLREILDGRTIYKWSWLGSSNTTLFNPSGVVSINGTKATPCLSADLFGDWREEVIFPTTDSTELRVFTTVTPATNRFVTLMHDPQYRLAIAWQNVAYNQPPHPGFYIGPGMPTPPPSCGARAELVWRGGQGGNSWDVNFTTNWLVNGIWTNDVPSTFTQGKSVLFDLRGSSNATVNLVGALAPAEVTVFSPSNYIFGGTGALTGTMALVKAGTGRLTINNTNTYTGRTVVREGTLQVNGLLSASELTVERCVWLNSCVGGTGILGNGLRLGQRCALVPGQTNLAGTLTVSNHMTLAGDTLLLFDLSDDPANSTNDRVVVHGNLILTGTNTIHINALTGKLSPGQYSLISYTGNLVGGLTNLVLSGLYSSICVLTNPPSQIAALALGTRAPTNLVWRGIGGNQWDTGVSTNWLANGAVERFQPLDSVRFDDTGAAEPIVNLVGQLKPTSVTVAATADYTFTGTGYISWQANLCKSNSGTLTILTTNDFTGPTVVGGGTLAVRLLAAAGTPSAIGAAGADPTNLVINGGTLLYFGTNGSTDRGVTIGTAGATFEVSNATATLMLGGTLVGDGGLTKTGPGNLILTAVNSFSGGLTLTAGSVTLSTTTAAGPGLINLNGGMLALNASGSPATFPNAVHVSAPSTLFSQGDNQAISGAWSGSADLAIDILSGNTFSVRGNMTGYSGRITLTGAGYFRWWEGTGSSAAAFDLGTNAAIMHTRNGGTIHLGALSGASNTVLSGASSVDAPTTYVIGARGNDTTFAGSIRNGSTTARTTAITKVGPGVLTLTGSNAYSGPTLVSEGALLVNGNHATATNTVTVQPAGTLGGVGVIGGVATVYGTLSPGAPIGTLTFTNTLTLAQGSVTLMELATDPRTNDQVRSLTGMVYGGSLIVTNRAGTLAAGDSFKLFDAPSYTGRFDSITLPPVPPALAWLTSKLPVDGTVRVITRPTLTPSIAGTGLVLSCTNGPPNEPCYVLTTTNLALPVSAWTRLSTNAFDSTGKLIVTNNIGTDTQRFYMLQVQ